MSLYGIVTESIGYLGMCLILGAFFLETRNFVDSKNWKYLSMMAVGSGPLAIRALILDELAFLILEVVWCIAAITALISITKKRSMLNQHIHE